VERERRGTHSITRTGFRVAGGDSLAWWKRSLATEGVAHGEIAERNGRPTLDFEDFEGQRLSLVDDRGEGDAHPWSRSPVPPERQIRGLGPVTISVPDREATDRVLTRVLGMREAGEYAAPGDGAARTYVYAMGKGGAAAELHVAVEPSLPAAQPGAGGAHHVAFRIPDADYEAWAARLRSARMPSSGPVDRFYFRSLYFREPGGILFEIATDGPGFATDEPAETMGESLSLPPFLESRRAEIERGLKPL
jgi:glyoxalase family protein